MLTFMTEAEDEAMKKKKYDIYWKIFASGNHTISIPDANEEQTNSILTILKCLRSINLCDGCSVFCIN